MLDLNQHTGIDSIGKVLAMPLLQSEACIEPNGYIEFSCNARLAEHVTKHVLQASHEQWEDILPQALIAAARNEYQDGYGQFGPQCNALATAYNNFLSDLLNSLCNQRIGHAHVLELTIADDGSYRREAQKICAWGRQERTLIYAILPVRTEQSNSYVLMTGFRPCPLETESQFINRAKDRLVDHERMRHEYIKEIHDGEQQS